MKVVTLVLIKIYQGLLPLRMLIGRWFLFPESTCRFRPTCSVYFYQAVNTYGIIRGGLLGLKRIVRCHPWSIGGHDPLL